MTKKWTPWHNNPFRAIQACTEENGRPEDWNTAKNVLHNSMHSWAGSPATYLRDVLEMAYDQTDIVVEIEESNITRYRAAYNV